MNAKEERKEDSKMYYCNRKAFVQATDQLLTWELSVFLQKVEIQLLLEESFAVCSQQMHRPP